MIRISIDGKTKADLPNNVNKENFLKMLSIYLFNVEIKWNKIEIEKISGVSNENKSK